MEPTVATPSSPRTVFKDRYTVAACVIKWMLKTPSISQGLMKRKIMEDVPQLAGQEHGKQKGGVAVLVEEAALPREAPHTVTVRSRLGCFTERQCGRISVIEPGTPNIVHG